MKNKNFKNFSVVIPTLGGEALVRTVQLINSGTFVPNEILICIPNEHSKKVSDLTSFENIKILSLDVKGQVRQRVEGFKKVSNDYVIQLDDDMFVQETCFERLMEGIISESGKVAIAPALIFEPGGQSCYEMVHVDSRAMTMIHGKNWFQPGIITRSGMNIGLNVFAMVDRYNEVDWIPGGCVIHRKENLLLFDYFPFKGKAFFEDVIQSIHLRKSGVKLLIDKKAVAGIDPYEAVPFSPWQPIDDFKKYYPYRKHVVSLSGNSILYLWLDGLYTYLFTTLGILKQKFRHVFKK